MDPFEELEPMAENARLEDAGTVDGEPSVEQVARWQKLFHYCETRAIREIKQHRADVNKIRVSNDLWSSVQAKMEGYDREAYEHELMQGKGGEAESASPVALDSRSSDAVEFWFRLGNAAMGEPLNTPEEVQRIAGMSKAPGTSLGEGEDGQATFCTVDSAAKNRIEQFAKTTKPRFLPLFITRSLARKELRVGSAYPTLGLDTTLPQHRPQSKVGQMEFPLWYFFYGTLADPNVLTRLLSLEDPPHLEDAKVFGGVIKHAGAYRALMNGPETAEVHGFAYRVESEEHEEALRSYETSAYEVV